MRCAKFCRSQIRRWRLGSRPRRPRNSKKIIAASSV